MKEFLKNSISKVSAEYVDARFEEKKTMKISFLNDKMDGIALNKLSGGHVRVLAGRGMAGGSFSDPNQISKALEEARENAKTLGKFSPIQEGLAKVEIFKTKVTPEMKIDPRNITLEEKENLLRHYLKIIQQNKDIVNTTFSYYEEISTETFVSSEGAEIIQDVILCYISGNLVGKSGNRIEWAGLVLGYDSDYNRLINREEKVEDVTKKVSLMLNAEPVKPGIYTIICDPQLGGVFIHEAFGHLSECDSLVDNPKLLEKFKLGIRIGSPVLNVVDQGNLKGGPGTYFFDHEGVASQRTQIIKEGILTGRLHSRNTAFRLGEKPTGNYRSCDYRLAPLIRMSNIYIDKGEDNFENMLSSIKEGYYLCGGRGGQTMGDIFTFGAQYGYHIKNGKLGSMVTGINISGNIRETLMNIESVGSDLTISEWGGCGRSRSSFYNIQMLNKSGVGSPHIKIKDAIIGGKS